MPTRPFHNPYAVRAAVIALCAAALAVGCTNTRGRSPQPRLSSLVVPVVRQPETPLAVTVEPARPEGMPVILARSKWAETAPIKSRLSPMGKITRVTVHHEGMGVEEEASLDAVKESLCTIQKSHLNRLHAGDIGYHYIIDCSGRIWEGRPIEYQGAHAGDSGLNRGNIGVVLMGNFNIQKPKPAQVASLRVLLNYLMATYDVGVSHLYTHGELKPTDCPGRYLQTEVDRFRGELRAVAKK